MADQILSFRDLRVYGEAFELQQIIFQISKTWPGEERYALTDQIRRSSRSIGANIAEAWAKRKYSLSFVQ
jgi:four helix bundle protein